MIITISGTPGSGKSTIAKALAKEFNLKRYSAGDFTRQLAEKKGLSLAEFSNLEEKSPELDKFVDAQVMKHAADDTVLEFRPAIHFLPDALKIFVKCSTEVAAKRIFKDAMHGKRETEKIKTFEDALAEIKNRLRSEKSRYKKYYGIDYTDESQYDIVIDTSNLTQEESIRKAIELVKKHLKKE